MRILHIEDDFDLRRFLKEGLTRDGFAVDGAENAKAGVQLVKENKYDLILVDIGMPGENGYWVIKTLRAAGETIGIFVISGQGGEDDKIKAFDAGADDYMVKPIFLSELVMRIRLWLRRREPSPNGNVDSSILTVGPVRLEVKKRRVYVNDQVVSLAPKEYEVLEYLMQNAGKVVTQSAIEQAVWSLNHEVGTNVVEYQITHIRKKIDIGRKTSLISTVRGSGYMMESDAETL